MRPTKNSWSKNTTLMPTDRPDYSAFIARRVKCAEPAAQAWKTVAKAHVDHEHGEASLLALAVTLGVLGLLWLTIGIESLGEARISSRAPSHDR